jgi:hypothetical protein
MSLHKKISPLRSNKFDDETFVFTHLIYFLYQILKFPRVSIRCVSKIQLSNGAVSSYWLISKIISATSWCGGVVLLPRCRDCSQSISQSVSQSVPTIQSRLRRPKDCIGGPEAYHRCYVSYMGLHLATLACGTFNWPISRRGLR